MPIYEYQCEKCCHCFEILVMGSDDEKTSCPKCGHGRVKQLSQFNVLYRAASGSSSTKGFS